MDCFFHQKPSHYDNRAQRSRAVLQPSVRIAVQIEKEANPIKCLDIHKGRSLMMMM